MPTIRPATDADLERVVALNAQGFNSPRAWQERMRNDPQLDRIRVAEDGGRVAGMLRFLPFAHSFGGRPVKAAGIGSVAVAAEARGRGIGSTIMRETLRELRVKGFHLSSLYPATVPIYKSVGYGFGGIRTEWKVSQKALPHTSSLSVEPFDADDFAEVAPVYESIASQSNGLVQRDEEWWRKRVLDGGDDTQYRYLVREEGRVTGYIVYTMQRGHDDWRSTLQCRDLHWTTPGAARALLALAALHRSTGKDLTWVGPPTEPLADLLVEDAVESEWIFRWMVRVLDVPGSLEARGYLPHVETGVTIAVTDPLFPENEGPWRIEVSGAAAKCARTDDEPHARADVQTWASIWSGLHAARTAARMGRLEASEDAIVALGSIFAGPLPWISDFY